MKSWIIRGLASLLIGLPYCDASSAPVPDSLFKDKDIVVKNLGTNVNSSANDYGPTITANGRTMYFTSDRRGGIGGNDFWSTKLGADNTWAPSVDAGPSINTRQDQGVSSLAADGQTIYFTGCNRPDGMGNCDIYVADLVGASWQNIRNLGPVVNTEYWESQPSISADGKTLYFASNRPGGMGGTDIWFTTKDVNGNWTEPQDLPAPVNSPDDENSPFISADGVTLYLSSNRKGGLGGFDFYTSEKVDSGWTKPENLGAPINSEHDDEFITVPASGDVIYFASDRLGGSGNLDIWETYIKPKPKTVLLVEGRVYDVRSNESLGGHVVYVDTAGDTVANVRSNNSTGEYSFVLNIPGGHFTVYCEESGHAKVQTSADVPMKPEQYQHVRMDIPMTGNP